ncbi:hypothetical protein PV326_011245 [Microctonus aethiopoides]|nr:hypothetical protein PV326_011245 [Microctonus aethiopoides]
MEKCFGQKIVLTGCKNPEKMLLNNDHKLITPLLNNLDKTHTAFNIGIQQQYAIIALLRVSDTVRPKNIDLAPPDYRIHPVRVGSTTGQCEIRRFEFKLSQPINAVWRREEDDRRV